ncbi:MAG TPA: Uma2 family endonuclease [Allosphingosinicella sp.]|nr:Uma2 family endonuclease [Allosphingosinicella sp.]
MNVETAIRRPAPVKLTVTDFRLLKRAGVFAGYSKSELLDGKLWGAPVQGEDEPESDAVHPIKLRVEDYLRLHEAGALDKYGRTELIDGAIYAMNPQHRPHVRIKSELAFRLRLALEAIGSTLFVGIEGTVAMPPNDAPEADIIVTSEPEGEGPFPVSSIALLAEVADAPIRLDLGQAHRYAAHGVPETWIVDVKGTAIHRLWSPTAEGYAQRDEVRFGERIEAVTIKGLTVATDGLR